MKEKAGQSVFPSGLLSFLWLPCAMGCATICAIKAVLGHLRFSPTPQTHHVITVTPFGLCLSRARAPFDQSCVVHASPTALCDAHAPRESSYKRSFAYSSLALALRVLSGQPPRLSAHASFADEFCRDVCRDRRCAKADRFEDTLKVGY